MTTTTSPATTSTTSTVAETTATTREYHVTVEARSQTSALLFIGLVFEDGAGDDISSMSPPAPDVTSSDWAVFTGTLQALEEAATEYIWLQLRLTPGVTEANDRTLDIRRVSVRPVIGG